MGKHKPPEGNGNVDGQWALPILYVQSKAEGVAVDVPKSIVTLFYLFDQTF